MPIRLQEAKIFLQENSQRHLRKISAFLTSVEKHWRTIGEIAAYRAFAVDIFRHCSSHHLRPKFRMDRILTRLAQRR